MKKFTILFIILFCSQTFAYNTPGTGVRWNLDNLVANSGGVVTFSGGVYTFNDTVKVSKNDTLFITVNTTIKIASNRVFSASGVLLINPPTGVLITALDTNSRYGDMRLDSTDNSVIKKMTLEYAANGLRISDCSPLIDSCIFRNNNIFTGTGATSGSISLFRSNATIQNSSFLNNYKAAIQGGGNINNAPQIINNLLMGNVRANANTPQINIGNTGPGPCRILNNQILRSSTNAGGISFFPVGGVVNVIITGNKIINNRYGINLQGGSSINAIVSYNQLDSNNTQNNPALGGSGIAFSGGAEGNFQNSIVTGNLIRWNLWGITIQGRAKPNLGKLNNADTLDDGKNQFIQNFTRRIDLFNTTPDTIYAQNNYWNTTNPDSAAARIFDQSDTTANYGPVIFLPLGTPTAIGNEYSNLPTKYSIGQNYPNPFNPVTKIDYELPFDSRVKIVLFDITGRQVMTLVNSSQPAGLQSVTVNATGLSSGLYFYKISASGGNRFFEKTLKMLLIK